MSQLHSYTEIVLVNPRAGAGEALRCPEKWKRLLSNDHYILNCNNSQEVEQTAARVARQSGKRQLTIVGGDGTVHHALNGLLAAGNSEVCVTIIPSGTANDYAAALRSLAASTNSELMRVDIGEIRCGDFHRYFFNVAGIGLTARAALASQPSRWWPAKMRYTLGLLRSLVHGWKLHEATIELDSGPAFRSRLLTLSVAIGQREGSFALAPTANLQDQRFEVLLASQLSRLDVLRYLPGLLAGRLPRNDPRIQFVSCQRVQLRSATPIPMHLDGEIYGDGTLAADQIITIQAKGTIDLRIDRG